MSTTTTAPTPTLPEPCAACGAPLDHDQRYCLHCGELRPGAARPLPAALSAPAHTTTTERTMLAAAVAVEQRWSLASVLAGLACLLLAMGVGVLIGRGGGDEPAQQAPITIAAPLPSAAAPTPATAAPAVFASDWPADKQGWTVALRLLPKSSTQPPAVATAKTEALAIGAPAAGALDADTYPTLTAGSYVVYSGVFDSKKAATDALKPLKAKFPEAQVVQVGQSAAGGGAATPKASSKSPASAKSAPVDTKKAFEESKKAPKVVGTGGGAPPAKDNKPAAGGGGFEEIG